METLFTWCAVLGGGVFLLQFAMLLMGLDGSGDLDFDAPDLDVPDLDVPEVDLDVDDASVSIKDADVDFDSGASAQSDGWFVGIITFRSLVAATAVFGFAGLGAIEQLPASQALTVATLAGAGTLYIIGWSFKKLYEFRSDGTVHIQSALGAKGSVYLTVPGERTGVGKVTLNVGGRTMEYAAETSGKAIPTGTVIEVTKILSEQSVLVSREGVDG